MKKLANDICGVVGGRHIHPIALHVGGMSHVPSDKELIDLKRRLDDARADLRETAKLFSALKVPDLCRKTEYVSLKETGNGEYAFYDGDIVSTLDPRPTKAADYRKRIVESIVEHSAAKHCRSPNSPTYAVGALARFNNNHAQLHPIARQTARDLGLEPICENPFHNNTAQLVESVHCVEASIEVIDKLLTRGMKVEPLQTPTRHGTGVGLAEVPRGLLVHEYTVDKDHRIAGANLIIPTGQNLANIEEDMREMVPRLLTSGLGREEMTLKVEMLVRAYDPCISCATHFLDVEWDE